VIKMLGIAQRSAGSELLDIRVHPTLIPHGHPLASVDDVTNAVFLQGEPIGNLMLAGAGAGAGATASAIVSDLINTLAAIEANPSQVNPLMGCAHQNYADVQAIADVVSKFYVRLVVREQPGVIGELGTCFGKHQVSLRSVIQKSDLESATFANVFVITQAVAESSFQSAIAEIRNLASLHSVPTVLRLL
ncbi:MAG: ACT domain-containing protein, partial [Pseudanabaenaceae cyanobacterium bins.68]|nr:ACT domain-containing protein [Pseudanabaenaceae cyanobacterium bins.68]